MVRPVMVQESGPTVVQVFPPGLAVAAYAVMADPPFEAAAVQPTATWVLPGVAVTVVGAPGTVLGVTVADGADGRLVPAAFEAVTVTV